MTQVTGLGIGNLISTDKTATAGAAAGLAEQFAALMNQNTNQTFDLTANTDSRKQSDLAASSNSADASRQNYEKLSGSVKKIEQATVKSNAKELSEKVAHLAKEVEEVIKETFEVTDEELTAAMETLGLSAMDLLQSQNLIQLVQELTGAVDAVSLLTDTKVQTLMQDVNGLLGAFMQENGLDKTQFADLLQELSTTIEELEQQFRETMGMTEDVVQDAGSLTEDAQPTVSQQGNTEAAHTADAGEEQTQQVQQETQEEQPFQAQTQSGRTGAQTTEDGADSGMQQSSTGDEFAENSFDELTNTRGEAQTTLFQREVSGDAQQAAAPVTQTQSTDAYLQVESLMNQMNGLARAFASSEGTTMQMQLNPENLGKLVLTVTEKNGNVTAQLTATNEQVKEVLQTQIAELHATLQTQGIKVEAVEVTVATHEFEQNLDGNASADAQMQQEAGGQGTQGQHAGRRNLDLGSMEALAGQMNDEEALTAQMMRDNGGSVDYTA